MADRNEWRRRAVRLRFGFAVFLWLTAAACENHRVSESDAAAVEKPSPPAVLPAPSASPSDAEWAKPRSTERLEERRSMVSLIRDRYGFTDERVLAALANTPRHWFVPPERASLAYGDTPLPIGYKQTISQPYIVAFMTGVLELDKTKKVLEIGTGSGYQAAVLNELTPHVYTIEIVEPLARRTIDIYRRRGYRSIKTKIGDGYAGWKEHQPFDAIIVTCAPEQVPPPLIEQLKPGGRLIIPVGGQWAGQELVLLEKDKQGSITRRNLMAVRFVPLVR